MSTATTINSSELTVDQLLNRVFKLPTPTRAFIAEKILATLDNEEDVPISEEWLVEISKRATEINDGTVTMIPAKDVFSSIRSELRA